MAFDKDGKTVLPANIYYAGKRKFTMLIKCIKAKEFTFQGKQRQKRKKD